MYAAAPTEGEAGWGFVYADPHSEQILQDDGETKKPMTIDESFALKTVCETGVAPPGGLWLGGQKYTVVQKDLKFESNDLHYVYILASRPKMGVRIVKTEWTIICGFYDEAKGQTAGNCTKATMDFAEYLMGIGY